MEALGERGVLVAVTGCPRGGAPGPGAVPGLPEIKEKSGIWNLVREKGGHVLRDFFFLFRDTTRGLYVLRDNRHGP